MKKMVYAVLAALIFLTTSSALSADVSDANARKTFENVWLKYRSDGILYEKEEMWMILIENQDKEPGARTEEEAKKLIQQKSYGVKKMTRYLKYDAGLLDKVYINFSSPARESNTQFTIWRYPDKHDDVWMYSPVLSGDRKIRRIPTAAQYEDPFMASALTYEDARRLMGEVGKKAGIFNFAFIGNNIQVLPSSRVADTGYTERRFAVDKNTFTKVFYYKNGQLAKIQTNSLISYKNGLWRPLLVEMYDVQKKFSTLLYFSERKFLAEKEVPPGIFEISYLNRAR